MYAIFQYRLEQALKVERLRVKISSDLHDDVGGMLSGLAMQTELLEMTANEETKPKLARVAEMSRSAMSRMRDTVWAIDARKDTLADLLDRMREHAEETLASQNIQYGINVNRLELDRVLTTDGADGFALSIHDNGKVTTKNYKTTGAGLNNMRMRATSIGATFSINTDDGYLVLVRRKSL
jgi:signal transduction histidine kinase